MPRRRHVGAFVVVVVMLITAHVTGWNIWTWAGLRAKPEEWNQRASQSSEHNFAADKHLETPRLKVQNVG